MTQKTSHLPSASHSQASSFTLVLSGWLALAPGLDTRDAWADWAAHSGASTDAPAAPATGGTLPKTPHIPMMTARRMSAGSRLAVEAALALLQEHAAARASAPVDALVFCSRHGELGRTLQIITRLAEGHEVSPTDFAASVHNTAAGLLTITAAAPLPASSVAAGTDTFQQALFEVLAFHATGKKSVLLVDFDGELPVFYRADLNPASSGVLPSPSPVAPHAAALLLHPASAPALQSSWRIAPVPRPESSASRSGALPQSLLFLQNHLSGAASFVIPGETHDWQWTQETPHS
ncbi:beta-ketoacyl synthase chain length factor [Geminisphaera colitermitum]|uniref:beta-ketoacyl synthase chain length factor n=1 Tax=Geminisphaera colitermitum TaxID=1148786 RepID=UPI0001964EFB|nr:beta-ketoacyl synthase chain length factor [Geminisphaera colitermitum]